MADQVLLRLTGEGALLKESLRLSTCARSEIYGVGPQPGVARRTVTRFLSRHSGVSEQVIDAHSYFATGPACVAHLFRTAAGLNSAVQGEAQILGQVRQALGGSSDHGTTGPWLQRLFQDAVVAGRRVRSETELGRGCSSIVGAAVHLMRNADLNLERARVCVLGAGETGLLMAETLVKQGVENVLVLNRTEERARSVAEDLGVESGHLSDLPKYLGSVDVVVGALASPKYVVTASHLDDLRQRRRGPTLLVDLSHPRSLDPSLRDLPGVTLLDLEHIQGWAMESGARREREVPRAEAIVEEEVRRHEAWLRARENVPVVRAVRQRVLSLTQRYVARHSRGASPEERERLEHFGRSLARALLHDPTIALRSADLDSPEGRALVEAATTLFGVDGSGPDLHSLQIPPR